MRLFSVVLTFAVCALSASAADVKMGFSVRDITPAQADLAKGIATKGWSGPTTVAKKVEDPLYVRTLAMQDKSGTLLVIVTADTCVFHPLDYIDLQQWFEKEFKTSRWHLIINASHTHQAPHWYPLSNDPYRAVYQKLIINAVKDTVRKAVKNAVTPVTVKFADLKINENMVGNKNSHLFKEVETAMPVFAFFNAKTNKLAGLLWSFSAHPTISYIIPGENRIRLSANVPGYAAMTIKKHFGANVVPMFAQGAAGELKIKFPEYPNLRIRYNRKYKFCEQCLNHGKGRVITHQEYINALTSYGETIAKIIDTGLKNGSFKEIKNIDLKIAGREGVIVASTPDKIPVKTKAGIPARGYYRTCGKFKPRKYYERMLAANKDEKSNYLARTYLFMMNKKGERVYRTFFYKVQFNKHFQIVAMSNEVCQGIGKLIRNHYKSKGMETVFWGYCPWGLYYPTDQLHQAGVYQGAWIYPASDTFSFDKFTVDMVDSLDPK